MSPHPWQASTWWTQTRSTNRNLDEISIDDVSLVVDDVLPEVVDDVVPEVVDDVLPEVVYDDIPEVVDDSNDEKEGSKTGSSDCTSDGIVLKKSLILEL